ncbi:hypothetical protein Tco_0690867, partial [Tanacetum coccineum]
MDGSLAAKRERKSRAFWNYPQGGRGRQAQTNAYKTDSEKKERFRKEAR